MQRTQERPGARRLATWPVVVVALLTLGPILSAAQSRTPPRTLSSATWKGKTVRRGVALGPTALQFFGSDGSYASLAVGPMDQRNVIVTLREPSLAETVRPYVRDRRGLRTRSHHRFPAAVGAAFERLKAGHQRFRDSLRSVATDVDHAFPGALGRTKVRREYVRALNGVALSAPAAVVERLRRNPDVVAVHTDRWMHATLADSVPMINAPTLWDKGITGAGVVVGIIDSGVDYTHPDLGAGFGPGFKVMGGYDFVNDDADPMDDEGHGTHVAGIVAADGVVRGVAPDARLVAYKVLDAHGGGLESDIVAAVETAADPDGDPTTDDALDIINLSLGGPVQADDPLLEAIDRVFDAGVLPVVAAGNDGNGYSTVASPGCARKALTVGATDKNDQVAYFSSRGPDRLNFALKPDIVAPGMAINSTFPSGAYAVQSGTSMAAPHVAGAAALLLQRDPTLSPADLKSLLMSGAVDLGENPFVQGKGRIDVAAAAGITTVADPPSLSFMVDHPREPLFVGSATVTLTNRGSSARQYDVNVVDGGFPEGLTASVSPATLTLAAGESGQLALDLSVDNALVPKVLEPPHAYLGSVQVSDGSEQIEVPLSVVRASLLNLAFDFPPTAVVVFDEAGTHGAYFQPGPELRVLVPGETYSVLAVFDDLNDEAPGRQHVVLREGLAVDTPTPHTIQRAEATHRAHYELQDERGQAIPPLVEWTFGPENDGFSVTGGILPGRELYFSDIAESFHVDWLLQDVDWLLGDEDGVEASVTPPTLYMVAGRQRGMDADVTWANESRDLRRVELDFDLDGAPEDYVLDSECVQSFGDWVVKMTRLETPMHSRQVYYASFDPESTYLGLGARVLVGGDSNEVVHSTPVLRPHDGVTDLMSVGFVDWPRRQPMAATRRTTFPVGRGPFTWFGKLVNTPTMIQPLASLGGTWWLFVDQTMSLRAQPALPYQLLQDGAVVREGTLAGGSGDPWDYVAPLMVEPGRYTLNVNGPSQTIAGTTSTSLASLTFDTTQPDPDPPYLSDFAITTTAGRLVQNVRPGQPVQVQFKAHDDVELKSARLSYRVGTKGRWRALPLHQVNGLLRAWLPTWLPGRQHGVLPISLRVALRDKQGNSVTHVLDPALSITSGHHRR